MKEKLCDISSHVNCTTKACIVCKGTILFALLTIRGKKHDCKTCGREWSREFAEISRRIELTVGILRNGKWESKRSQRFAVCP